MQSIAVVGGTGFLGSATLSALHRSGLDVRSISRATKVDAPWPHYKADLADESELAVALSGVDTVFHAAGLAHINSGASGVREYARINVEGTRNVAVAARAAGVKRMVLASSVAVYGTGTQGIITEETECKPDSVYGQTKLRAEEVMREPAAVMTTISLRFASVYGPGAPGNVGSLARRVRSGTFVWIGSGCNRKSLLYIEDAVDATIRALGMPVKSQHTTYNVGGIPHPMKEIVALIAEAVGRRPPAFRVPAKPLTRIIAALDRVAPRNRRVEALRWAVAKWLSDDVIDSSRFSRDFGWEPQVSLPRGIQETFRSRGSGPSD